MIQAPAAPDTFAWDRSLPHHRARLEVGSVAYTESGAGPPVVLIHGYGDSLFTWRHQLAALGDRLHLYALDLIGYGLSDKPPVAYTAELFIDCVRQFMRAVGVERATLVGSSMGAAAALCVAKYTPNRVERLVLLGPTIPGVQPAGRFLYMVFWLAHHGRLGQLFLQPSFRTAVRMALRDAVADPALITDAVVDYYFRLSRQPGFRHAYVSTARHWHAWITHRPRLGELKMPVLVIWGEQDQVHPLRQAGLLQTLVPQSRLVVIPQCGHLPHSERPEQVNTLLRGSLADLSR